VRAEDKAPAEPSTVLGSYGEVNYNRPRNPKEAQADLRRFVLSVEHRFDERTRLAAEVEIEHAVSSSSDPGEVEVEQAWVERQLTGAWSARGGLFLIPIGLLNESHEPTAYYGVERNFVETAIIPTTWREGGLQVTTVLESGVTVQAGLTTSFDLGKWDSNSTEGIVSPLGAVHQELALARAHDFGGHLAVNWRGVPGLQLGAAAFAGNASQGQGGKAMVVLWDGHARWTPWRFDLSALYARGTISGTARLNAALPGPVLIPAAFDGGYLQAAIHAATWRDLALSPFARWERYCTGKKYETEGPAPAPLPVEDVFTLGANLGVGAGVVLKGDVQSFPRHHARDRLDLGLGWSF
jgi:hypothetical protein